MMGFYLSLSVNLTLHFSKFTDLIQSNTLTKYYKFLPYWNTLLACKYQINIWDLNTTFRNCKENFSHSDKIDAAPLCFSVPILRLIDISSYISGERIVRWYHTYTHTSKMTNWALVKWWTCWCWWTSTCLASRYRQPPWRQMDTYIKTVHTTKMQWGNNQEPQIVPWWKCRKTDKTALIYYIYESASMQWLQIHHVKRTL